MDEELKAQLEEIRASGETNMVDFYRVQWIAFQRKYYELVNWLTDHKGEYLKFLLTGEEPDDEGG